jgi:membrane AbrB-like protein
VKAARDSWVNPLLAVALCAGTGAAFAVLRLPLPWMIGPLAAMACCNFAGTALRAPRGGREFGQIVIGTALGLYFTPLVAREVISYWPLLLLAGLFAVALGACAGWILSHAAGIDRTTAFFASVAGGAAEMTLLGERYGARPDHVALAQSLRILAVVIVVPFALTYSGAHGSEIFQATALPVSWGNLVLLLGIAALAAFALNATGVPNAFMFGPLAVVIALTIGEVHFSSMPTPLSNTAQVLLGCALGARFQRRSLQSAPRFLGGVLLSVAIAMAVAAAFAAVLAWLSGLPIASLILATAPGGIAEMCITAKVLQLGVPLVTAAHVTRVAVLITTTGPTYRAVQIWRDRFRRK